MVDGFKSPAGWLPVHQDQLPAQRSVTSMGELYFTAFLAYIYRETELFSYDDWLKLTLHLVSL